MKKENQIVSFQFGKIQLLDSREFLGGATSLDSLLKGYKPSETKSFFHYERFDHPDKMQRTKPSPYEAFYSIFRSCNLLEATYMDFANLLKRGLTTKEAVIKLELSKPPPTGVEKYQYKQRIWRQ